jgi:hypothetical protein
MATLQLSFSLRTTSQCKSVHLLGSWDNYQGQLPLTRDSSKSSANWAGTFRFTGGTLNQGSRYWYYYIMDGYHCTHDPAKQSVLEPTTQRKLNILDVPAGSSKTSSRDNAKRSSRRMSKDIPHGRGVSPSKIKSPKPYNPAQTKNIVAQGYNQATVDELTARFGYANINEEDSDSDSDADSDVPSLTSSRSSNSSSPSSASDVSSCCTCERYGITRSGNRVKLDCGGARCGYAYSDASSSCASDSEEEYKKTKATRRHGVVIRG